MRKETWEDIRGDGESKKRGNDRLMHNTSTEELKEEDTTEHDVTSTREHNVYGNIWEQLSQPYGTQ
jgi:hypothetical protein